MTAVRNDSTSAYWQCKNLSYSLLSFQNSQLHFLAADLKHRGQVMLTVCCMRTMSDRVLGRISLYWSHNISLHESDTLSQHKRNWYIRIQPYTAKRSSTWEHIKTTNRNLLEVLSDNVQRIVAGVVSASLPWAQQDRHYGAAWTVSLLKYYQFSRWMHW